MLTARQFTTVTEEELSDWDLISKSPLHATLRKRPIRRQLQYDPTRQINLRSDPRYQLAAEGYIRGIINSTPCDHCVRGVEPFSRGLPVYPECVSVPVSPDADVADSDTCWLMRGACMNCHHRSYANCSCRKFLSWLRADADVRLGQGRLSELGNPTTPVRSRSSANSSAPGASAETAIKLEDSPSPGPTRHSRAQSVTMEEAPALRPMGVTTTASRSQHLRRPRFDYEDPAARAVYEAQLLEELDAVRSDEFLPGSSLSVQPFLHSSVHLLWANLFIRTWRRSSRCEPKSDKVAECLVTSWWALAGRPNSIFRYVPAVVGKMRTQATKGERKPVTKGRTSQAAKLMSELPAKPTKSVSKPSKPDQIYAEERSSSLPRT